MSTMIAISFLIGLAAGLLGYHLTIRWTRSTRHLVGQRIPNRDTAGYVWRGGRYA